MVEMLVWYRKDMVDMFRNEIRLKTVYRPSFTFI